MVLDHSICKKFIKFMSNDGAGVISGQVMGIPHEFQGRRVVCVWSDEPREFKEAYQDWKDDEWGMDIAHLYMYRVDVEDIICQLDEEHAADQATIQQIKDEYEDLLPRFRHIHWRREFR